MPSNVQRGNTRLSACIYCQQTRHSSSDCPSRISGSQNSHARVNPQYGMKDKLSLYIHEKNIVASLK
ncbi:hypothetical protein SLEP1_g31525 [Rubroshorea leprosula]|uniref:CCHC-type domain-containing protein n=1 Tax=Rubroshorea leprosula TaxID=152421 RepID=A0AAV5KB45_9ROSI|nr:hypothetical protein SLEP1_g31525 [Rubroshorea leprosula]